MNTLIIILYALAEAILIAKYNSHVIREIRAMYTIPGNELRRRAHHSAWHKWQLIYRAAVFCFVLYALAGFTLHAVALAAVAAPAMWITFNHALNLFRGLPFFHKGKNDLDTIYRFGFMFFLFEVLANVAGWVVWYLVIFQGI